MAVTFVNAAAAGGYNNSAGDVTNAAQNVTTGNALVVFVMARTATDVTGTATCSDTAGNTYTRVAGATIKEPGTGVQLLTFYALNVTGHASNVIVCDLNVTNYVAIVSLQFAGVATASALGISAETTQGPGTPMQTVTSPPFTTTQADEVVCAGVAVLSNALTFTADADGYTIPTNGVDPLYAVGYAQYQIFSGVQTNVTVTSGASSGTYTWAQGVISLKGATESGPPEGSGTAALSLGATGVGQSIRSGLGVAALTLALAGGGQSSMGTVTSCEVLSTGWQAKVGIAGFKDGGTYDFGDIDADVANAKVSFTVVSEGYSTAGVLGTKTRTVYGTRVVQKAYPNHATREETESGGNVELTIALSDYIYDDDNTGAGKSGTAPTVTIASGWYTDNGTGGSGTSNAAVTNLPVTNSSTQDYPKVIARWAVVPYQRFTSTFDLECVAFHRFAENGKPVACVKFTGEDTGTTRETITTTEMVKSAQADNLPCYKGTLTASNYTDNAVVTANFTAYPWVGDADSVLTSVGGTPNALTLGPLPLLADPDDDYGVTLACVNTATGNNGTGVASPTYATAAANPFANPAQAVAAIAAYNNANHGRNNANAGIVYLQSNNHSSLGGGAYPASTTDNVWVTITRDPNVAKADARITGAPNDTILTALVRLHDLTIVPTGFVWQGNTGRYLWLDGVDIPAATQQADQVTWGHPVVYHTHCSADKVSFPFAPQSSSNISALIRGCSATNAKSLQAAAGFSPRCVLTTTLDHGDAQTGVFSTLEAGNTVIAYCRDLANPDNSSTQLAAGAAVNDCAVVCNLLEDSGGTQASVLLWGDGNTSSNSNLLVWHNTVAGERVNIGYNDGASAVTRTNYSLKYNSLFRLSTKHDVYTTDATRTGAWSILYGVGWVGNHTESSDASFPHEDGTGYAGMRWTHATAAGYTDDKSGASGVGYGDYTPDVGSVLIGKIATAADVVIPWDINGTAYATGGCAGAITLSDAIPEGSGTCALTLGASGVGQSVRSGVAAAALTLALVGSGTATHAGTGTAGLTLGATGTGQATHAGSGTASLTLGASGAGVHVAYGTGTAPLTLGVVGVGDAPTLGVPEGTGMATLTLGLTGAGAHDAVGTGTAPLTLTATAAGLTTRAGAGTATLTLTAVGVGSITQSGAGTATLTLTVAGAGVAGLVDVVVADAAHTWVVARRMDTWVVARRMDTWTVPARRDTWRIT